MKVTLNRSPRNEGNSVSTAHLLSPDKASSGGTRLHSIKLCTKAVPWKSPNNSSCCKEMGCSLQTDSCSPTAKDNTHKQQLLNTHASPTPPKAEERPRKFNCPLKINHPIGLLDGVKSY